MMKIKINILLFALVISASNSAQTVGVGAQGIGIFAGIAGVCATAHYLVQNYQYRGVKLIDIPTEGLAPPRPLLQNAGVEYDYKIDISEYGRDVRNHVLHRRTDTRTGKSVRVDDDGEAFLKSSDIKPFERAADTPNLSALSAIGLVRGSFRDGFKEESYLGTGLAIRGDAILTAAHNVILHEGSQSKRADWVGFCLGYDNGKCNRMFDVKDFKVPQEYEVGKDPNFDFAVLFLPHSDLKNFDVKLASLMGDAKADTSLRVAGYPGRVCDKSGKQTDNYPLSLYSNLGKLIGMSSTRQILAYNCWTDHGMSGGPVLVKDLPVSVGVHRAGDAKKNVNLGVHCSEHVVDYLGKWFAEAAHKDSLDEPKRLVREIARNRQEEDYLIKKLPLLANYSPTNLRGYMALLLDLYREGEQSKVR